MNLSNEPVRAYPKQKQLSKKRIKPLARTRGAISQNVRQQLKERSQGMCERCRRTEAVHAAHVTRRWKQERTTVDGLLHLCIPCHVWCDTTKEGREYLKQLEEQE